MEKRELRTPDQILQEALARENETATSMLTWRPIAISTL